MVQPHFNGSSENQEGKGDFNVSRQATAKKEAAAENAYFPSPCKSKVCNLSGLVAQRKERSFKIGVHTHAKGATCTGVALASPFMHAACANGPCTPAWH